MQPVLLNRGLRLVAAAVGQTRSRSGALAELPVGAGRAINDELAHLVEIVPTEVGARQRSSSPGSHRDSHSAHFGICATSVHAMRLESKTAVLVPQFRELERSRSTLSCSWPSTCRTIASSSPLRPARSSLAAGAVLLVPGLLHTRAPVLLVRATRAVGVLRSPGTRCAGDPRRALRAR